MLTDRVVLLSGEHATLPLAELRALLAVHAPDARVLMATPSVARIQCPDPNAVDAALARMAGAHQWSELIAQTAGGEEGLVRLHEAVNESADGTGSIAVRAVRSGAQRRIRTNDLERTLGAALGAAGHPVDLASPDHKITAWIHDDSVVVGRRVGDIDRSRFEARRVDDRDHFSPIGLHPRRALGLVHLARSAPEETILDPFCGTGGILLEAALDGHDVIGSDLDQWMVQGTLATLADAGPDGALPGVAFEADIGDVPELLPSDILVGGIVTDLPYGKASTTAGEGLTALYDRAFTAFAAILDPGRRVVFGCADPTLGQRVEAAGFRIAEHHEEYVHGSMTRHYLVAVRDGA